MIKFARDEYERNRDVVDIAHIRYLISVRTVVLIIDRALTLSDWAYAIRRNEEIYR